jgi:hypothetical protein
VLQGRRFSQIRYGSQVDLIVPLSSRFDFTTIQETGDHVEAGVDPLIKKTPKNPSEKQPDYEDHQNITTKDSEGEGNDA